MKLTPRFVLLIIALVAAVAASTVAGHTALRTLDRALDQIVRNDVARLLAITHSRRLFRSLVLNERDYVMAKSDQERDQITSNISDLSAKLTTELDEYARLMPEHERSLLEELRRAHSRWLEQDAQIRQDSLADPLGALQQAQQQALVPRSWDRLIAQLVASCEAELDARVTQTHAAYLTAEDRLLLVSLVAVLLGFAAGWLIFVGFRRNLANVVRLNGDLEAQMSVRTEQLTRREKALSLVLDSTGDGLIEVGRDGRLTGVCSVAARRWFGSPKPGTLLTDYLLPADPTRATQFSEMIAQLADGLVPIELWRDHLPRKLIRGALTLELDFKRVAETGQLSKILVTLRDVSDTSRSQRAAGSSHEYQSALTRLLTDKTAFAHHVADAETLLALLACSHDELSVNAELSRLVRRLDYLGAVTLVDLCHHFQSGTGYPTPATRAREIANINSTWNRWMLGFERYLIDRGISWNGRTNGNQAAIEALFQREDCDEILSMVEAWSRTRTVERLSGLRAHAEHLAERLGKSVRVTLEHNNLRLPSGFLEKFWPVLIQVVRSTLQHSQRTAHGTERGDEQPLEFVMATLQTPDGLLVEVRAETLALDRAELLRQRRIQRPFLPDSVALRTLVFMEDGDASLHASSGSSLAAVRQACEEEGGTADVVSGVGRGTSYRFRFRWPTATPGALAGRLLRHSTIRPNSHASESELGVAANSGERSVRVADL